eukprot:CAMPEP_0206480998 /NCGR_PEP_ID=MMETSP0324_2-20121206/37819_1 /ASSEMBLY_ACC=CAM_ASM_000836 /TAXON_ID=2866 /ORGANISM="Crypthecodinium cohnii, Strain Seligo" /LENGTH=237 /DNA_ID=CAMNT_0053958275 /DNA_START=190 /DNA_END=905 /DNA_ORIENTATION=-
MVPGPPPRAGSFQWSDGTTLRVTGFGPEVRNTDLQPEFGEFGHVLRIHVIQGKGVAFVEYREREDASEAMRALDGKKLFGVNLSVVAAPPPPDPRRKDEDGDEKGKGGGKGKRPPNGKSGDPRSLPEALAPGGEMGGTPLHPDAESGAKVGERRRGAPPAAAAAARKKAKLTLAARVVAEVKVEATAAAESEQTEEREESGQAPEAAQRQRGQSPEPPSQALSCSLRKPHGKSWATN